MCMPKEIQNRIDILLYYIVYIYNILYCISVLLYFCSKIHPVFHSSPHLLMNDRRKALSTVCCVQILP